MPPCEAGVTPRRVGAPLSSGGALRQGVPNRAGSNDPPTFLRLPRWTTRCGCPPRGWRRWRAGPPPKTPPGRQNPSHPDSPASWTPPAPPPAGRPPPYRRVWGPSRVWAQTWTCGPGADVRGTEGVGLVDQRDLRLAPLRAALLGPPLGQLEGVADGASAALPGIHPGHRGHLVFGALLQVAADLGIQALGVLAHHGEVDIRRAFVL